MATQQEPTESPVGWVADHAKRYIETNGEDGHIWRGVPTLALTTTGRRTGTRHRTMLIYGEDDGRYLIVASKGGAPKHPQWYLNLKDNPEVELQVGADRFNARARTATAEEKPALWKKMAAIWPAYDEYQTKTSRDIPLVILQRT